MITIPPTLEMMMVESEKITTKAKEEQAKSEKDFQNYMKVLFEVVGKKQEEWEVVGYQPGKLKIKRRKK